MSYPRPYKLVIRRLFTVYITQIVKTIVKYIFFETDSCRLSKHSNWYHKNLMMRKFLRNANIKKKKLKVNS